ncbi:hypothetical protein AB0I52_26580 [Streptomyces sp. NPDC050423]|uniref:hypothetical protein n=1 Tax=Streptomyces sp. NPDC050423 TaxID=3155402 RepID=UPI0034180F70
MSITVCLPARAADQVETAVARAMAPFEIDHMRGDDLDIWDSWRITGGTVHGGGFNVLAGHERDARLIHELPSRWLAEHEPVPNDFGWCAGGPRGLLDLSASREEAMELADLAWQRWHELALELPTPRPRQFYDARHSAEPQYYSSEQASADYDAQPLVRAFEDFLGMLPTERYSVWFLRSVDPVVTVGSARREEFIALTARSALRKRNALTLEGWWYEGGTPGIHGLCHSPVNCRHKPDLPAGYDHIDSYLAALPSDVLLVNVHCHV